MTVYGDLEISTLRQLPSGRGGVASSVVPVAEKPAWLDRAWERLREEVAAGRQAYVVCPRIGDEAGADDEPEDVDGAPDDGPRSDRRPPLAVLDVAELLRSGPLAGLRLDVLHGRLTPEEKDARMRAFAAREIDVLVATTVVEVGVDVPNATVMVVMDADRFGVSQLHQLRGRVARGKHAGLCLLVTEAPTASPTGQRLAAVAATSDGFELARLDLETRREGDVLGAAQSGQPLRRPAAVAAGGRGADRHRPRRGHRAAGDRARARRPPGPGRRGRRPGHRRARGVAGEGVSPTRMTAADLAGVGRADGGSRCRAPGCRPTGDRAREALFNSLGSAGRPPRAPPSSTSTPGSGALGLEALSRGAGERRVRRVRRPGCCRCCKANLAAVGLPGGRVVAGSVPTVVARRAAGAPSTSCSPTRRTRRPVDEVPGRAPTRWSAAAGWRPEPSSWSSGPAARSPGSGRHPSTGLRDRRYGEALLRYGRFP